MNRVLQFLFRHPDEIILNPSSGEPYLRRWWLLKQSKGALGINVYLHEILQSDSSDMHDHPWESLGVLLSGEYLEHIPRDQSAYRRGLDSEMQTRRIRAWEPTPRGVNFIHRLELDVDKQGKPRPVWSLFLTGPNRKNWGYFTKPGAFVHWAAYVRK